MKKLLATTLILLPLLCKSEPITLSFEAMCDDTKVVAKKLLNVFKEVPVLTGDAGDVAESKMSLWTNPDNDSWTIVATKENLSCVIGFGGNLKIIDYKKAKRTSNKQVPNM